MLEPLLCLRGWAGYIGGVGVVLQYTKKSIVKYFKIVYKHKKICYNKIVVKKGAKNMKKLKELIQKRQLHEIDNLALAKRYMIEYCKVKKIDTDSICQSSMYSWFDNLIHDNAETTIYSNEDDTIILSLIKKEINCGNFFEYYQLEKFDRNNLNNIITTYYI